MDNFYQPYTGLSAGCNIRPMPDAGPCWSLEQVGAVMIATIERPQLALEDLMDLTALATNMGSSDSANVLVLTGKGDTFAVSSPPRDPTISPQERLEVVDAFVRAYLELDRILVVAVNGEVANAGLTLALLADIVVIEEHVSIRDPHVLMGVASASGPYLWPPAVGLLRAKRYILTGEELSAQEAERIGLVTEVVSSGESLGRALELATSLASLPPLALRSTKLEPQSMAPGRLPACVSIRARRRVPFNAVRHQQP